MSPHHAPTLRRGSASRHATQAATPLRAALLLATLALLPGCALLGGGKDPPTIHALDPRITLDASAPSVRWQLALPRPTAVGMIDSQRIVVLPVPGEMQVYKGAQWAKRPTDMLEDAVLRALEDSGRIPAVARQGSGVAADYRLVMDLRRFDADYAGAAVPSAVVEVNAKLLHAGDQDIVASRTFRHARAAAATDVASVASAFDGALAATTRDIATWVLATGQSHDVTHR